MTPQSQAPLSSRTEPLLVVIPCLNEEQHIERVVGKLLAEANRLEMRIVVADGGSTDRSRAIVQSLADRDDRVALLDNPQKIQSAGVNSAVKTYGSSNGVLIRVDAHAEYPDRYCEKLLAVQAESGADSVVVSMHTEGATCFQRAAAAAQNSILGNGGAAHRNRARGAWVGHGHHALMTMRAFTAVGGYDDSFSHVEDVELDIRLRAAGFRIFLTEEVAVTYYPRKTLAALFRQYFRIGHGRARNFLKHRRDAKLRHFVLAAVAPAIVLTLAAPFSLLFAAPALVWGALCLTYGILIGIRRGDICSSAAGIAAMSTQAGWSFGFFTGLIGESRTAEHSLCGRLSGDPDRIAR